MMDQRVMMAFPGGGGYGSTAKRDPSLVARDLMRGYISPEAAKKDYGLNQDEVAQIEARIFSGFDQSEEEG